MADAHLLDRPVWSSLTSGWAALAEGNSEALRLRRDHGPFGAAADPCGAEPLAPLVPEDGELWLVERDEAAIPTNAHVDRRGVLAQMVMEAFAPKHRPVGAIDLGDGDALEMQALASATRPGPFAERTHRLGAFIGIRRDGRLVAMAGERMRMPGYCEVSGVCTDPAFQGRGLAGALMSIVCARILERGDTPFLHSYAHNAGAIGLYESLGFRTRATIHLTVLKR